MNSFALSCIAAASALFSLNALAQAGTIDTYCGTPKLGAADDLQPNAPTVDGLVVTSSTNHNVKQVISKFGKHTLTFTYEDAPHFRRIAADVAKASQSKPAEGVCIDAEAFELSQWGTPVEVLPVRVLN